MSKFVLTAQLQLQGPNNVRQVVNQIQSQLGKGVNANINLQGGPQAQRQLQQIAQQANKASSAAGNMGKALGVSIRRFTGLAIATRAVSLFTNNLGAAIKESIAFERELIKISQVTGKTIKQLSGLTQSITSLATGLGVSSTALLSTSRILSQAGLSARETEVALKALAKTELAPTFENITRTAEGAVAIFNQFGKGAAGLEGQLGSLNAVAGKFAVESGDLIAAIRRTGGVFKAAGGDLNQLIALFTSVRSTTRESAESIATGLRTILTRIQRPKTIEYLRQYGVELETLEGKFIGPFEAVKRLSQATKGLEEGDLTFVKIAEQIAGFRQIGKVIPLLRQFRVAQEALSVAQKGTNSLTEDAAKAQAALSVRITKVKEEFLALIRSITETVAFQAMASTVLTLAESLITLGEAIKPILPLLGALFAVRAVKGLGNFAAGIGGGLSSAKGFASGGMVPGSGNRDTVPAMLTPGEFVIKKSSVSKMGASNLSAMNNNRYAKGGIVANPGAIGGFFLSPQQGDPRSFGLDRQIPITNRKVLERTGHLNKGDRVNTGGMEQFFLSASGPARQRMLGRSGAPNKLVSNRNAKSVKDLIKIGNGGGSQQKIAAQNLQKDFNDPKAQRRIGKERRKSQTQSGAQNVGLSGSITGYFPGRTDLENGAVARQVRDVTKKVIHDGVLSAAQAVGNTLNAGVPQISMNQANLNTGATNASNDLQTLATTEGYLFEGIINALTGATLAGGKESFDFPSSSISSAKDGLKQLFTNSTGEGVDSLIKADAKRTASTGSFNNIVGKLTSDINAGKLEGLSFQKFASGGAATGSDTVPAMLTPGEFVVSKSSAKSIGYGNLKSMNQVGKYAAGGIVSHNRHAYGNAPAPMGAPGSLPGMAGPALTKLTNSANMASGALAKTTDNSGKLTGAIFGAQMVLASLTPTIDETSSTFEKLTAKGLGITNTLLSGFMIVNGLLATFGAQLTIANTQLVLNNTMNFLGDLANLVGGGAGGKTAAMIAGKATGFAQSAGKGIGRAGKAMQSFGQSKLVGRLGQGSTARKLLQSGGQALRTGGGKLAAAKGSQAIGRLAVGATRLATGFGAVTIAVELATAGLKYFLDNTQAINKAIAAGDVEKAGSEARTQKNTMNALDVAGGAAAGAGIGALFGGPFGAAVGAVVGGIYGWNTGLKESTVAQARSAAAAVKANNDMAKSAENASENLKKFQSGGLSQEQLGARSQSAAAAQADKEARATIKKLSEEQTRETTRNSRPEAFFSTGENDEAIKAESQKIQERRNKAFAGDASARSAVFRDNALKGGAFEDVKGEFGPKEMQKKKSRALANANEANSRGDTAAFDAAMAEYNQLNDQLSESRIENNNLSKSVTEAKAKFDALNIGLSQSAAAIGGASVGIDNLVNSLDSGTPKLTSSIATLEASTTSAAGGISPENMQGALDDVSNSLLEYGADPAQINKFRQNQTALMAAQSELPSVFERMKDQLGSDDLRNMAPADLNDAFKDSMKAQLESQGMDQGGIDRVMTALPETGELTKEQTKALSAGDLDVFQQSLTEAGKEAFEKVKEQAEEAAKIEKQMIELTKRRIEAENNLIKAQQSAIDISMEARNAEAAFGGKAVSIEERRSAVAAKSNVLGRSAGLSDVGTDVGSFRRRREEIRQGFSATQLQPGQQQTAENESQGDRLKQAQQEQVQSLRELIKIQKDEIKTIQEKQRLEKESLDSLLSGDIDKFFEQQAAQGAIAASATGNQSLMNSFGASAMGDASQELGRMKAAGVGEVFGQQIGGPGGLQERAALSGLQQRGLQGQGAVRASQIQAGTTPEQAEAEARGRKLAGELAASGDLGAGMAADELQTAGKMLQEAARILQESKDNAQGSSDRGKLTRAGFEQADNVSAARDKLAAAQEMQAKIQEDLAEKNRRFSAHVEHRTKMERAGIKLDEDDEAAYQSVLDDKIDATRNAAMAQEAVQHEEAKVQKELNKAKAIDTEMRKGRLQGPAADMTRPESAPKSMIGGFLESIGFSSSSGSSSNSPSRADMLNSTSTGGAGVAAGGIGGAPSAAVAMDENSVAALDGFSQTVDKLAGTEIGMVMQEIPINLNAPNFLASMEPAVQNMVIDAIQSELETIRPSSGGMKTNKGVLPQRQS